MAFLDLSLCGKVWLVSRIYLMNLIFLHLSRKMAKKIFCNCFLKKDKKKKRGKNFLKKKRKFI
jgi:hypothetical protein